MNTFFISGAFLSLLSYATNAGPACEPNPNSNHEVIVIRESPDRSARTLASVKPNTTNFREIDIISRGRIDNDWIKVEAGNGTGWINAGDLQCRLSPAAAQEQISIETKKVIDALRNKDLRELSKYAHPIKGVRFSPGSTVGLKSDVVLSAEEIGRLLSISTKRVWGYADGSGAALRLSPSEYYKRFVYDRDFAKAPVVNFNTFAANSTDRNNTWDVYPNGLVVEYYFPPSTADGNDWASLRLVYEKHEGRWFLSGLIHDTWTI